LPRRGEPHEQGSGVRQQQPATRTADQIRSGQPLGRRERLLAFGVAAVVSLLAHAGVVLAALEWATPIDPGASPESSDAVSVELAPTDTLDALKPDAPADPAPSPEATAPVAGSPTPAVPAERPQPSGKREPTEKTEPAPAPDANGTETRAADRGEPPDVPFVPTILAAPAPEPFAATVPEPPKEAVQGEAARAKPKEAKRIERKAARPEGGITLKAKAGKGTVSERASASTGSLLTYADQVRARVASNRPSGSNSRPGGTAVVAFGLTSTGGLAYARIARSSGDAVNDGIALAAVRGAAPFPTPPAGASPTQLQFTFPYYFQ